MAFYLSVNAQLSQGREPSDGRAPGGRRVAFRIAASQFAIAGVFAAGFGLGLGLQAGLSALVGGTVNALANLYLAHRVFGGDTSPQAILKNLYIGEFVKIGLTVALFVLALMTLDLAFLPLFVTYAATLFAFWIALLGIVE